MSSISTRRSSAVAEQTERVVERALAEEERVTRPYLPPSPIHSGVSAAQSGLTPAARNILTLADQPTPVPPGSNGMDISPNSQVVSELLNNLSPSTFKEINYNLNVQAGEVSYAPPPTLPAVASEMPLPTPAPTPTVPIVSSKPPDIGHLISSCDYAHAAQLHRREGDEQTAATLQATSEMISMGDYVAASYLLVNSGLQPSATADSLSRKVASLDYSARMSTQPPLPLGAPPTFTARPLPLVVDASAGPTTPLAPAPGGSAPPRMPMLRYPNATRLNVPYAEKERAKSLGALYEPPVKELGVTKREAWWCIPQVRPWARTLVSCAI